MKCNTILRLKIFATQATSKEPVGPALGQVGIPIMDFCNKFNNLTVRFFNDVLLNVLVYSYGNQNYDFVIKFPDLFYSLKRCFIKYNPMKKPGYVEFPIISLQYVSIFMLYELIEYYCIYSFINKIDVSIYKKIFNSLKSCGFLIL
ncbi:ribosomal protein L11 (mitochondrion) [Naegleria fowleri]|uniref:Ribosomal protein L11 n=1 Tax=Naegleria fowleri TaxID=5763 RepID=M4H741_NAEFO|nr:ribosomal protein L11 [Naegleria fowleri]AFP72312.1 ribosomal protein L11 [Naegleria fowleri]AOS85636.1 ribosomal protein L11 [Naegleria fowleri]AOS85682.1 ribosomal protein L11 [Naegleria fowleri]UAT97081.1 ribosomal protein L11 [Naegleria fowleri]WND64451.1 hypothetical protein HHPHBPLO_00031 [Naegleria fowleri]